MIDPTDPDNIYSSCDMGGLYYSHDSGKTWARTETAGRLTQACIADNGTVFSGGYGLYASSDNGESLQMIYPKNIVYEISRCGWNENLIFAPGFDNGYLTCLDTADDRVYFTTIDWTGSLRLMSSDYNGDNFELLCTEQTQYYDPTDADMWLIAENDCLYIADTYSVRRFDLSSETMSTVYEANGSILKLEKIGGYWFILDDGESRTQILYTADWSSYGDLMDFNTIDSHFTVRGQDYTIDWHFDGISGNNFQSIFLSLSCDAIEGIMKFDGKKFHWVYDSENYTREVTEPGGWSYGCHGPFYGVSADPSNDDRCIASTIETVYLMELDGDGNRNIRNLSSDEWDGGTYSTRGLNVQTTYSVNHDPFDDQHMIIATTDMGLQISYNGGQSWRRMDIIEPGNGISYEIYNTCYDLYMDRNTKDLVYGLWSSRHDAPYSPTPSDTGWTEGAFGISTDGGITWNFDYSTGLPEDCIPVNMSVQETGGGLTIAVATFNRGFFISYDSGKTFTSINDGMNTEDGLIWGEDIVLAGSTVYCLTAPYMRDGEWILSELYIHNLISGTTQQADLGELVLINSLTWDDGTGLYLNVTPTYHYQWMDEYNDGFWLNDNGGVYHYDETGITQILAADSGVINSTFAPDGTMYAVDTHSKLYKGKDGEFTVMADNLFYMLKNVSVSPDGGTLYVTTHGGGTYRIPIEDDGFEVNTETSMYCWDMYLLNEGSFPDTLSFLKELGATRVYQDIPEVYLAESETADMVSRLTENDIEVAALTGDRSWGLAGSDLSQIKSYIDALVTYNETVGAGAPVTKVALDVETYTYSGWDDDPLTWFTDYIEKMQEIYNYAKGHGLSVVQVIPTHFDEIDRELFTQFLKTCADEISVMNYTKSSQLTAIAGEVEICRQFGMPIETIFETMPENDYYSVTEENTYFYDGFEPLSAKRDEILKAYRYENLTASYHHFPTMFHVVTGAYLAEIYAYTNSDDPTRNELGQTEALKTIILTGDDGSVITAGLYNPNRGAQYEENCFLAVGVRKGVTYTITSGSPDYEIVTSTKTFDLGEDEAVDYSSIRIRTLEQTLPVFTVTFRNYDGTVLKTQKVEKGSAATAPSAPYRVPDENGHYTFAGWDCSFDSVNDNLTITAVYDVSEHTAELINAKEATCTEDGYTGDLVCSVCGEVVETGSVIARTGHTTKLINAKEATCTEDGYTGDLVCSVCGKVVETGSVIDKTGHRTELINAKEATCTEDGYTGDLVCSVCGEVIETGSVIYKTGHSWAIHDNMNGTHSQYCTLCGAAAGITSDCTDNNGDGQCDICGGAVETSHLPDKFVKTNSMTNGKSYLIFSGSNALGKSLKGTKLTMRSANGVYVPDDAITEELLWYYSDGKIFCNIDGTAYYLGCNLLNLYVTTDESDAAIWTCSNGQIYTKVNITSWWQSTMYLSTLGSRFTASSVKKTLTVYEAC